MALKTYDPAKVSIIVGPHIVSGFADGSFVTVEQNEDDFTLQMGTDGDGTRSKSNNRSSRVTLRLMQSSASNAFLSAQRTLDLATPNGDGIVPFFMADKSGNSLYAAVHIWVVKPPSAQFDREATEREWILETESMNQFEGGD